MRCGAVGERRCLRRVLLASILGALVGCTGESPSSPPALPEKRCGDSPETYFSVHTVEQLEKYADCTVLVGHFQEDSVTGLEDLAGLKNIRRVEGIFNVFRSPGFRTLHGLENLEVVDGHLFIHMNPNLASIAALAKLRSVTGNLFIGGNDRLPQAEVERIAASITVGGVKDLKY